jgi:hypothetical protein
LARSRHPALKTMNVLCAGDVVAGPHRFVAPCVMDDLTKLSQDPRVTRRRPEPPDPDCACVWYWIERAQRGIDNPALDVVVDAANALRKRVVVFLARVPYYPNANLHHYHLTCGGRADSYVSGESTGWKVRQQELH